MTNPIKYKKDEKREAFTFLDLLSGLDIPVYDLNLEMFEDINSKNKVLQIEQISEGSLNSSVVHPREVFMPAVLHHAAAILAAHNHPSGDPTPSKEDKDLTKTLAEAGKYMGIPVLDHIIIGDASYFSFKEHSYL